MIHLTCKQFYVLTGERRKAQKPDDSHHYTRYACEITGSCGHVWQTTAGTRNYLRCPACGRRGGNVRPLDGNSAG